MVGHGENVGDGGKWWVLVGKNVGQWWVKMLMVGLAGMVGNGWQRWEWGEWRVMVGNVG